MYKGSCLENNHSSLATCLLQYPIYYTCTTYLKGKCDQFLSSHTHPHTLTPSQSSHIHSVSEHLQLYYQSMRKFRSHFQQQEASLSLLTYDLPPQTTASQTQTGSKRHTSRLAAYRKKATWLPYVKLRPTFDPRQVEAWAAIEESVGDYIDPVSLGGDVALSQEEQNGANFSSVAPSTVE